MQKPHIYGLDFLRLLAAVAVAIFHLTWAVPSTGGVWPSGWIGVQIFFVISGFVIANSAASSPDALHFARARALRLYPAAWLAALLNAACCTALIGTTAYLDSGLYTTLSPRAVLGSLLLFSGGGIATAYWTLPVECAFYALIATQIALGGAAGRDRQLWLARALALWSTPYVLLLWAQQSGLIGGPSLDFGYGVRNMTLLRHGPYFALGMLMAEAARARLRGRDLAVAVSLVLVSAVEIGTRATELAETSLTRGIPALPALGLWRSAFAQFVLAVGLLWLSIAHSQRLKLPGGVARWVRNLGLATYPLYLLHECVGGALLHGALRLGLPRPAALAVALTSTLGLAFLLAAYAEPRARRALAWLLRARAKPVVAPAPWSALVRHDTGGGA